MAITPLPSPTPAGVVADARAEVGSLRGSLWSARTSSDLVEGVEELQRLKATVAALEAEMLAELDARETPRRELGWASTADWYAHCSGTTRRGGKRSVTHARALTTDRSATLAALHDGAVSPDQAEVILAALDRLPTAEHSRRRGESVLIEEAGRLNATDLLKVGRHLARVVDPGREDREDERALDREDRAAHLGRHLSISEDGMGGIRVTGRGTVEDGTVLRAALLPLSRPAPTADPQACEQQPDTRDHGARTWDALVRIAQHALDTDLPPRSHGNRPRVVVTVDHDTLHGGGTGIGVTEDGLEVVASAVRRMACDCDLVRVRLDEKGCVLDVGRTQRLVTPAIWTALVTRDQHCAFPGCSRPPVMCHAHHVVHWIDHGPTCLDNLVLVCGHHHRTLHGSAWQVRIGHDRRPEFLPPATSRQPEPTWTRHRPRLE